MKTARALQVVLTFLFAEEALFPQAASAPKPQVTFSLGSSFDEVFSSFGPPTRQASPLERYWDVKTTRNAYLIRPWWGFDDRESRLNPKMRVSRFDVILDRPSGDYQAVLSDFQQAADICSEGCDVGEQAPGSYVGSDIARRSLAVYPPHPTTKQAEDASLWSSEWRRKPGPGWLPVIFLAYDEDDLITRITFGSFSLTETPTLRPPDKLPKKIATWSPKSSAK